MTVKNRTTSHGAAIASHLWGRAVDLVFPPRCAGCGGFGGFLCDACLDRTAEALPPRCDVCWMPAERPGTAAACSRCRAGQPAFRAARSAFVYEGAAREAVHALKYDGVSSLARPMAHLMFERLVDWKPPVDALAPVPLAGRRRRTRGYNQSELLARELARLTGLRLERRALVRQRAGAPQVGQPDEEARRRNVSGAFAPGPVSVKGSVLLIDDVLTTGATLDACARVLLGGGAEAVFALTFARED